jgi:Cu(I)/Ag(I) efflux system membrane fusion protein
MKRIALFGAVTLIAMAAAAAGYWFGSSHMSAMAPEAAPSSEPQPNRKVLYWYDPMFPQQKFDKPGKSPFMDMQLVPKYADEGADEGAVTISPHVAQNLGIRTAEARPGSLSPKLTAVGSVEYNERSVVLVQTRTAGFVERLYVRAPLDPVAKGDPLVEILFPDWAAAQEEYLLVSRLSAFDTEALKRAARQRLALLGMSEEQIAAVEREGRVQARVTLRAPISGVIAELGVREGMTVAAGAALFRIASLGTVWIVAEVPEALAAMLIPGATVETRVPAYPEDAFSGRVSAILPEVNATTRTVRARVEVANRARKLKPGMYATLTFSPRSRTGLLVPTEAVIRTGERNVVILADASGKLRAVDVEVGMESGGESEIRKGLNAGDRVVVSGQFLIDSEASLRGTLQRLNGTGGTPVAAAPAHKGEGILVSGDGQSLLIKHGEIPSAKMGAMTMEFRAPASGLPAGVKAGDRIRFEFTVTRDGEFQVTKVEPLK